MHIDKSYYFYPLSLSSTFPFFQINDRSLKIRGVALTALTFLGISFYLLYVKMRERRISHPKGSSYTHSSVSSFFQGRLQDSLKRPQSKEGTVKFIENLLQQNPEAQEVYLNSLAIPTALLQKLIQNDIPLDEKEITSLYTLRNSKGETFSLTGFEKALLMQHSVPFNDFWREKKEENISLIEDRSDFDLLKTLLQSLYDPQILEKKETELCSLAAASIKFQLNQQEVNKYLETLLVMSFEKDQIDNIKILLSFFTSFQKPLTKAIQTSLQSWLNRSIGTPAFSAHILILKDSCVTSLDFSDTLINDQELSNLRNLSLSTLILKNCKITDQDLEHLQSLTQLQHLDLTNCKQITGEGLKFLQTFTQLQHLNLTYCYQIKDQGLKHLETLTQLQHLNLSNCKQIKDQSLKFLESFTQLQYLNLTHCYQITDQGLNHLQSLTQLQKLELSWCRRIKIQNLNYLQTFTQLQYLNLTDCSQITDQDLKHLKNLIHLQELNLNFCSQITGLGLEHLQHLTQLKKLNLSHCYQITDQGLEHLKHLAQLKKLNLSHCKKITDQGLNYLQSLTQLQKLNLINCDQIKDQGLNYLQSLTQLQGLKLAFCRQITDQGIEYLQSLIQLQYLNLTDCKQITDQGMGHLQSLSDLKELTLIRCNQISSQALAFLTTKGISIIR